MSFIAVIADIVASRSEKNRSQLQEKLLALLEKVNLEREHVIVSPYTVTLGDEFQVLYHSASGLFSDLWCISATLYPVKVRYSIALGELTTPVNKNQALGMDGPVFHIARDGLNQAKSLKTMFRVGGQLPNIDLINDSLMLISHLAREWNANRLAIASDLSIGIPVKETSRRLRISESAVYKNIHAAALDTINAITVGIEKAIEPCRED